MGPLLKKTKNVSSYKVLYRVVLSTKVTTSHTRLLTEHLKCGTRFSFYLIFIKFNLKTDIWVNQKLSMFRATAEYTSTSAKNFKDPKSKYFQWIFSELWCVLGINTHLNTQKKGKDFINNLYIDYRLKYFGHIKLKFNIKDNCTFFL